MYCLFEKAKNKRKRCQGWPIFKKELYTVVNLRLWIAEAAVLLRVVVERVRMWLEPDGLDAVGVDNLTTRRQPDIDIKNIKLKKISKKEVT